MSSNCYVSHTLILRLLKCAWLTCYHIEKLSFLIYSNVIQQKTFDNFSSLKSIGIHICSRARLWKTFKNCAKVSRCQIFKLWVNQYEWVSVGSGNVFTLHLLLAVLLLIALSSITVRMSFSVAMSLFILFSTSSVNVSYCGNYDKNTSPSSFFFLKKNQLHSDR